MEPLLHSRESTVLITAGDKDLRQFDVVLYKRPGGDYVLHRIRRIRGDKLWICGDNMAGLEKVPRVWVLGKMTGYYPDRGSRFVDCKDKEYLKYVKALPLRSAAVWIRLLPGRIRRKLHRGTK